MFSLINKKRSFYVPAEKSVQFDLASDAYIPQYIIDKFNQMNILLWENGIYDFFLSFNTFLAKKWQKIDNSEAELDFEAITLNEFSYVIAFCAAYFLIALIILFLEIIWFRLQSKYHDIFNRCERAIVDILRKMSLK